MSTFKTTWGKGIALAMAATLIVSSVPGTEAQAAKKAKLSTKKLTVQVGKKKTIKIKNKAKKAKYTFKSKKASIAKVSKKGVVTGKKAGSTKITVTEKNGKKKRKLGTVKVTVKKSTPTVTNAPVQTATPAASIAASVAPSTNPSVTNAPDASVAPSVAPTVEPSKGPTAVPTTKPTKAPTPVPTEKPNPSPDLYEPSKDAGWVKLDLSKWSGDEGSFFEGGNQFVLDDVELETVPLPESPVLDQIGDQIEVLIRGSLSADSSGFRFWLANANAATLSEQYYFTENSVGIGAEAGNTSGFNLGQPFHIQTVLKHTNHDGSDDMTAASLLLKGPAYGTYLAGVTITGIWVRYGDKIGTTVEEPTVEVPGNESGTVESGTVESGSSETPGGTPGGTDKSATLDLSKASTYVCDKGNADETPEASYDSAKACLDVKIPQFTGIILKAPNDGKTYKKVKITYTSNSLLNFYLLDGAMTDGTGQTPDGQHEIENGLAAASKETTAEFEAASDYAGGCLKAIKIVHVDFDNSAAKNISIKSVEFLQ